MSLGETYLRARVDGKDRVGRHGLVGLVQVSNAGSTLGEPIALLVHHPEHESRWPILLRAGIVQDLLDFLLG